MNLSARRMESKESGFTLIELLVVIIIIGVLGSIAVPVYLNQKQRAIDASLKSDIRQMAVLQTDFMIDNGDNSKIFANLALRESSNTRTNPSGLQSHNRFNIPFKASEGNWVKVVGVYDRRTGTTDNEMYCIIMWNMDSKEYYSEDQAMIYRSDLGTILPNATSCGHTRQYL